jgi:cyanophycinase
MGLRRFAVERMRAVSVSLTCAAMGLGAMAQAPSPLPSHGPAKGYLVITGGGPDYKDFLALAGGKNAHIVVIPTAAITRQEDEKMLPPYCDAGGPFAGMKCTVLHTTDRKVADSPEFVAPLKDATGVYLEGGRHWRLADAYLGTLTLKEMFGVLDRGGVIMGGSAGATIQGSYMVRGSSNPDDNTIMMAPGHEIGFGFFTNVTIDQHVDTRHRENDLAPVMKAHPQLLGLGLDQSTSITVHGDTLTVNGPKRVAVWDGKDHAGKGYYYLRAGDTLNTATRVATVVAHAPDPKDNPITLPPEKLARYVGAYQLPGAKIMAITLENGQLISQITGQPKVPLFALEDGKFFPRVVDADLDFVKDADGEVTSLTLHQNGNDVSMPRLSDSEAKRVADQNAAREAIAAKRFAEQKPAEGSEAAIRKNIADVSAGTPDYDTMSPGLAAATRQQLDGVKALFAGMGAVKSVTFKRVEQSGADVYVVEFEHGSTEWRIVMGPDGKIDGLSFRPV